MKIIVIHTANYKETDLIVDAITENENISFKIRGGAQPNNPFTWLNNPLTVADVDFVEPDKYKHPVLLRADLIKSPQSGESSLDELVSISLVAEVMFKMISEEERYLFFNDIVNYLDAIKKPNPDVYTLALIFLAKAIKISGFELEVSKCVHCGSTKNIVAFSFDEGGFICKHCLQDNVECDLNPKQMKLVRFVFCAPDFSYPVSEEISADDKKALLTKINYFINDIIGIELRTINLMLK